MTLADGPPGRLHLPCHPHRFLRRHQCTWPATTHSMRRHTTRRAARSRVAPVGTSAGLQPQHRLRRPWAPSTSASTAASTAALPPALGPQHRFRPWPTRRSQWKPRICSSACEPRRRRALAWRVYLRIRAACMRRAGARRMTTATRARTLGCQPTPRPRSQQTARRTDAQRPRLRRLRRSPCHRHLAHPRSCPARRSRRQECPSQPRAPSLAQSSRSSRRRRRMPRMTFPVAARRRSATAARLRLRCERLVARRHLGPGVRRRPGANKTPQLACARHCRPWRAAAARTP